MMAGEALPEPLWRAFGLTDPPAVGLPSGLFQLEPQEVRHQEGNQWDSPRNPPKGERRDARYHDSDQDRRAFEDFAVAGAAAALAQQHSRYHVPLLVGVGRPDAGPSGR